MAKLADLARIQRLWTKIKNTFVAKDSNGNVTIDTLHVKNDITLAGHIESESGGATFNDDVNVKAGYSVVMHSEDNSKQVEMHCDENGTAIISGHTDVKGSITAEEGATFGGGVDMTYGEGINFHNDDNSKSAFVNANSDCTKLLVNNEAVATEAYVTTAVANAGHLKRKKVDALPGVATAQENVIYMVSNNTTGDNKFVEYMFIDGAFEKTGSSDVDLSGYPTTEEMNTAIANSYTLITDAEIDALT